MSCILTDMSATVGDKGGWREERLLGSGGFGAVHLWKHKVRFVAYCIALTDI